MDPLEQLTCFRGGGWVRDHLLGVDPKDCDWVVVGASTEVMLNLGFKKVGRDFPVFLHPETKEEYALARTRRNTGHGNLGFEVYASPDVTLEDDLRRRDLTMNAIAMDRDGNLIDPFGGIADIKRGTLRHVGDAFSEDPIRILRTARFAARYGFVVAPETHELMCRMASSGDAGSMTPERVWIELENTLRDRRPSLFIKILHNCGALVTLFPELSALDGVPQPEDHHPEVDSLVHVLMALDQAERLTTDPVTRFAVLMHDLGKGLTSMEDCPYHIGHEAAGVPLVDVIADRYRIPNDYRELARMVGKHHLQAHRGLEMRPNKIVRLFQVLCAFRCPANLDRFVTACEADARGRLGLVDCPYPQAAYLREAFAGACKVYVQDLVVRGYMGERLGEQLYQARIRAVREVRDEWKACGIVQS